MKQRKMWKTDNVKKLRKQEFFLFFLGNNQGEVGLSWTRRTELSMLIVASATTGHAWDIINENGRINTNWENLFFVFFILSSLFLLKDSHI